MQLSDVIEQSAAAALRLQRPDGAFPAGRNGPYRDTETPARNTAHWLVTLLDAHARSGQVRFLDAAARAAAYLTTPAARPHGATFLCRTNPAKDGCNGLIGQAWVIEALSTAASALGETSYRTLAERVFQLHPFDSEAGVWRIVDVNRRVGPVDRAFNHQLWFAVAGSLLDPRPDGLIGRQVHRFLDASRTLLRVAPSGRIRHRISHSAAELSANVPACERSRLPTAISAPLRRARSVARAPKRWLWEVRREIGYHAFNLYGFAVLRQRIPTHPVWESEALRAALHFLSRAVYSLGLEGNPYGYPYNPSGLEVAFALQVFGPSASSGERPDARWVTRQLARTYDWAARMMNRGTDDQATLAARLYEACRLRDVPVKLGTRRA